NDDGARRSVPCNGNSGFGSGTLAATLPMSRLEGVTGGVMVKGIFADPGGELVFAGDPADFSTAPEFRIPAGAAKVDQLCLSARRRPSVDLATACIGSGDEGSRPATMRTVSLVKVTDSGPSTSRCNI